VVDEWPDGFGQIVASDLLEVCSRSSEKVMVESFNNRGHHHATSTSFCISGGHKRGFCIRVVK
jgi:hypothetical protein